MNDKARVVFLDRDGVINQYPGHGRYVTSPAEFVFLPGSIEAIRKLNGEGFHVFVVSNQQGVAKGIYTQKTLDEITRKMLSGVKKKKARLDGVYYCTHLEKEGCSCRKPETGLLQKALSDHGLEPGASFFVGDSMKDVETARKFGVKSVLVLSGREKISRREQWKFPPDFVFDNLLLAAHYICAHGK